MQLTYDDISLLELFNNQTDSASPSFEEKQSKRSKILRNELDSNYWVSTIDSASTTGGEITFFDYRINSHTSSLTNVVDSFISYYLSENISFVNLNLIKLFLVKHYEVMLPLIDIPDNIKKYFIDSKLEVELVKDQDEFKNEGIIFILIGTKDNPKIALSKLNRLTNELLIGRTNTNNKFINFDLNLT